MNQAVQYMISVLVVLTLGGTSVANEIPVAAPESVGMSTERLKRVDQVMAKHIDAGNIQGGVTVVARHGRVVHFEAHGFMDANRSRPMQKDALFIMMSSTKPVLGVAAMIAIEEGLMRPSDPVSKYLPEFAEMQVAVLKEPDDEDISPLRVPRDEIPPYRTVPAHREVTIHDLLTHTSGLSSGGLGAALAPRVERDTLANYIPKLGAQLLDFQPGSRWVYSAATGLDVVARIIEIVTRQDYLAFVQARIFDPLGMVDTHYNVPGSKADRRVIIEGRDMARYFKETSYFSGSYGLTSSARDYLHFEQMLINGGVLFGQRVLSPRSIRMMSSDQTDGLYRGFNQSGKGSGFGYTVGVVMDPILAKSRRAAGAFGWGGAFGTRSWSDPVEGITGVLMLQQPHRGAQYDFENAVQQAIIE